MENQLETITDTIDRFVDNVLYRSNYTARLTWRDKVPTLKQRRVLVDNGYRVPASRGAAFDLIATFADWSTE